jgi:hypothetical protein
MDVNNLSKKIHDGDCSIVIVQPESSDVTRISINETMHHNLPPDQTYKIMLV